MRIDSPINKIFSATRSGMWLGSISNLNLHSVFWITSSLSSRLWQCQIFRDNVFIKKLLPGLFPTFYETVDVNCLYLSIILMLIHFVTFNLSLYNLLWQYYKLTVLTKPSTSGVWSALSLHNALDVCINNSLWGSSNCPYKSQCVSWSYKTEWTACSTLMAENIY